MNLMSEKESRKYDELCQKYAQLKADGNAREAARTANAINRLGMPTPDVFGGKIVNYNCLVIG